MDLLAKHPNAEIVIVSADRLSIMDYTSIGIFKQFQAGLQQAGKKLYITDIHDPEIMKGLKALDFAPEWVKVDEIFDLQDPFLAPRAG